eukprot:COSAG06_NODE_7509_length_2480_cov_1.304914_1_plen_93_part_00
MKHTKSLPIILRKCISQLLRTKIERDLDNFKLVTKAWVVIKGFLELLSERVVIVLTFVDVFRSVVLHARVVDTDRNFDRLVRHYKVTVSRAD